MRLTSVNFICLDVSAFLCLDVSAFSLITPAITAGIPPPPSGFVCCVAATTTKGHACCTTTTNSSVYTACCTTTTNCSVYTLLLPPQRTGLCMLQLTRAELWNRVKHSSPDLLRRAALTVSVPFVFCLVWQSVAWRPPYPPPSPRFSPPGINRWYSI